MFLNVQVVGLATGKVVSDWGKNFVRRERLLVPLRELGTDPTVPLKLVRGRAYLAQARLRGWMRSRRSPVCATVRSMSPLGSRSARLAATLLGACAVLAPSAQAQVTTTPLGSCTAPNTNRTPSFGALRVTNPVTIPAQGYPAAQLGVTVRTKASPGAGGPIALRVDLIDLTGARYGGSEFITEGCARLTIPFVDLATAAPLPLQKGRPYLLRVTAGYTNASTPSYSNVFAALAAQLADLGSAQFTGFFTR